MFSPSARRVAFKSPLAKVAPTISTTVSRVTASKALPSCNHQRRLSSSKPSTPANGPKRVAEGQDLPTTSTRTKAEGEKKASPKAGRRKEKDAVAAKTGKGKEEEAVKGVSNLLKGIRKAAPLSAAVKVPARNEMQILPRVQNTNQVDPKEFDASSFFALHRPIAVGAGFPPPVTDEAFDALFTEQPKTSETAEIIAKLSRTFRELNSGNKLHGFPQSQLIQMHAGNRAEELLRHTEDLRASLRLDSLPRPAPQHLDGNPQQQRPLSLPSNLLQHLSPSNAAMGMKIMLPVSTPESSISTSTSTPGRQSLLLNIKIHKDTLPNGEQVLTPFHAQLIEHKPPPTRLPSAYRQRVAQRQERSIQRMEERMQALSVKRIRKLKMKKKKFKKLQKKTRTERRKQERG